MLQQTQVARVTPYYDAFLKRFPTVRALAEAPLSDVLKAWQGLGYNRRAKMLHEAAKAIVNEYGGTFPRVYEKLLALPGIGPYTVSALRAFAWNQPAYLLETNIRSALIHKFFPGKRKVRDAELAPLLKALLPREKSRDWNLALMDYGAYLKRSGIRLNARSAHHTKQKPFKGSNREIRGAILKVLSEKPRTRRALAALPFEGARIQAQLKALVGEGLVGLKNNRVFLPEN